MSFKTWFQQTFPTVVSQERKPVVQCACGGVAFRKHPVILAQKAFNDGIPDTKWLNEVVYFAEAKRQKYMAGVKEYECVQCGNWYDREEMVNMTGERPLADVLGAR